MFSVIFNFEFKRWFRNYTVYVYMLLFFGLSLLFALRQLCFFNDGKLPATMIVSAFINSPRNIFGEIAGSAMLIYFLVPSIVGASVYRDFKYNMHPVLFTYPFTKKEYLFGKLFGTISVVLMITFASTLGYITAQFVPGINKTLLGPVHVMPYLQCYVLLVIPNLIFLGALTLLLVTITRNNFVGFVLVMVLFMWQSLNSPMFNADEASNYRAALLDPFGTAAIDYEIKSWKTLKELDTNNIPFKTLFIYNRLIWIGLSTLLIAVFYRFFSFSQNRLFVGWRKKGKRLTKDNFETVFKVDLPQVTRVFSLRHYLKTTWWLSNQDYKYVVKRPLFIFISLMGLLVVMVSAAFFTKISPETSMMAMLPANMFKLFLMFLTFMFSGLLIHRGKTSRMGDMIDSSPVPTWVLVLSKFLALVKVQLTLILLVILTCMGCQAFNGHYQFEIGQYVLLLMVLGMLSNIIWLCMAFFTQTLLKSSSFGLLLLLFFYMAFFPFLQTKVGHDVFRFDKGPDFQYVPTTGFVDLGPFLAFKFYWLLFSGILMIFTLLLWRRGLYKGIAERWKMVKFNFNRTYGALLLGCFIGLLAIGATLYYTFPDKKPLTFQLPANPVKR